MSFIIVYLGTCVLLILWDFFQLSYKTPFFVISPSGLCREPEGLRIRASTLRPFQRRVSIARGLSQMDKWKVRPLVKPGSLRLYLLTALTSKKKRATSSIASAYYYNDVISEHTRLNET